MPAPTVFYIQLLLEIFV